MKLKEGRDYVVITVDFAENESPDLARNKKKAIIHSTKPPIDPEGWRFTVGENNSSGKIASILGFKYKPVKTEGGKVGYIHPALTTVLMPDGTVSAYLEGINTLPADLELSIRYAAQGKLRQGHALRGDAPFCYTDKPKADIFINRLTSTAGILSILAFLAFYLFYLRRKRAK
jgi:protein SCO1/2